MKKYELIQEGKFFRIKALKDFGDVKKGELGGLVSGEHNLSQEDNCWVFDNAKVLGNAIVFEDAQIFGNARVFEDVIVFGNAIIYGNAKVSGYAKIYGNARVFEDAEVSGYAQILNNAQATKKVITFGNAFAYDITITDKHIKIGCQQHLKLKWLEFTNKEILEMEGEKAMKFWKLFRPFAEINGFFN